MSFFPGPVVDADWLSANIGDVAVVDVRWYLDGRSGANAYSSGHIPTAVWADLDTDLSGPPTPAGGRHPLPSPEAFAAAMGQLGIGDDTPVVAYDDTSGMVASRLWFMLDMVGHPAAVLDGGIQCWSGPLSTNTSNPSEASFSVRPWPTEALASAEDVANRDDGAVLIDARNASRFAGEPNEIDPRFGHIPGARHADWNENFNDSGTFAAPAQLQSRFADLGIDTDTAVIAYCGSGVSACANLLGLRLSGHRNARLYVGSWSAWGADLERPVETGT